MSMKLFVPGKWVPNGPEYLAATPLPVERFTFTFKRWRASERPRGRAKGRPAWAPRITRGGGKRRRESAAN